MFKPTVLVAILLVGTLSEAMQFVVREDNSDCILLSIEFSLDLIAYENGTQVDMVQLGQDTGGLQSAGNCATPEITLSVPNSSKYDFTFNNEDPSKVRVDIGVSGVPNLLFSNSKLENVTGTIEFPAQSLDLGSSDKSWVCHSHLTSNYPDQSLDGFTFSAEYTIFYIRVQAYNVVNNTFSDADECSQDPTEAPDVTTPSRASHSLPASLVLMCAMYLLFVSIMF